MLFALLALLTAAFAAGCGEETEEPHIHIGDMESGAGITSAADLAAFFESGGERAVLARAVDMEDAMLTLSAARGHITIEGRGNTISGNADCVIRLEDGAELTLEEVNITGGAAGIGGLGSGKISGQGAINAVAHAVDFAAGIEFGETAAFISKATAAAQYGRECLTWARAARFMPRAAKAQAP